MPDKLKGDKTGELTTATIEAAGKMFRGGQMSNLAICQKYSISHQTLIQWVKKYDWKKDLSRDVRVTAKNKSMAGAVEDKRRLKTTEEKRADYYKGTVSQQKQAAGEAVLAIPEEEIIEEFSNLGAAVLNQHRGQIKAMRGIAGNLSKDLMALRRYSQMVVRKIDGTGMTYDRDLKVHIPKALKKVQQYGKNLEQQSRILRDLSQLMARLVPLERQAYSLDSTEDERTFEQQLKDLYETEPADHDEELPTAIH